MADIHGMYARVAGTQSEIYLVAALVCMIWGSLFASISSLALSMLHNVYHQR